MQAVVLAAGKGTRLRPLTNDKPKVLVEVDGTPLIEDLFDNLLAIGATELVVVGYKAEQIIDRYGDEYDGVPITYTHQREQLGLAHAILQAEPHIDGDFMLMLGDNVFRGNLGDVANRQQDASSFLNSKRASVFVSFRSSCFELIKLFFEESEHKCGVKKQSFVTFDGFFEGVM